MQAEQTFLLKTGHTATIRRATAADAAQTIPYLQQVAGESDFLGFGVGEFNNTVEHQINVIESMNQGGGLYIIAVIDGEIASLLSFEPGKRARKQHVGELGITVQKKYWCAGIGTKMMQYLLDWARETGTIRKIDLRVSTDNEVAIAVYEKVGFVKEGLITRNAFINGKFHDCYFMGIPIDPPHEN